MSSYSTCVRDFIQLSNPNIILLSKGATKKYPAQVSLTILKTQLRGTTRKNNPVFNIDKRSIIKDTIQTKDNLYKPLKSLTARIQ